MFSTLKQMDRLRASDAVNNTILSHATSNMQIEQTLAFLITENANPELSILRRNALIERRCFR